MDSPLWNRHKSVFDSFTFILESFNQSIMHFNLISIILTISNLFLVQTRGNLSSAKQVKFSTQKVAIWILYRIFSLLIFTHSAFWFRPSGFGLLTLFGDICEQYCRVISRGDKESFKKNYFFLPQSVKAVSNIVSYKLYCWVISPRDIISQKDFFNELNGVLPEI